ncbi:hypothetical protein [uncultured Winogradskyella sp.]|uniref:nSTAND3 domain-containing NTPase n=1 Tax=uncultured Winogradskyella sp. TaxID=395353 RepID=UPI002626126F|nr:hypothetical protein [uncultured Winogradskyella sp.]
MITRIEAALKECNGDVFANLSRQYLVYRYSHVFPTGFVLGKEKSKIGTPDNFIPIGDYYIYNEITTKTDNILSKLKADISHCFKQTDVPKDGIVKIILICNSVIDVSDYDDLKKHLSTYSKETKLEVLSIKNFANQIFKNYPSLARKLGLPIDTWQILEMPEFIEEYQKSKFATTLLNKFYNRETELSEGLESLNTKDILILTGAAGTGKTKFAIELIRIFLAKYDNYHPKVIRANGVLNLWDDLQNFLLPDVDYIILVDDANRLKSNLDYLINFKNKRTGKGKLKIILTIRNYVLHEIGHLLDKPTTIYFEVFQREELKKILQSNDFNINDYWADRIWEISKGNPRLAVMAAEAGNKGELEKLNNPAQIMHEYFSSVRETVDKFEDQELLKVMGILSLFRTIDFSNTDQIKEIEHYFGIDKEKLQIHLKTLFKIEIADELFNAYKIADQILGEYLIFLIFLKEKTIPFTKLLEIYFHKDAGFGLGWILIQQINNFNFKEVFSLVQTDIKESWKNRGGNRIALPFIKDFYCFIPIETLSFISEMIEKEPKVDYNGFNFEIWNKNHLNSYGDKQIDLLLKFQNLRKEHFNLSLNVLLEYCLRSEQRFQKFLKACVQSFVMSKNSFYHDYSTQTELFKFLFKKLKENEIFISKLILFIAPTFLKDTFRATTSYGKEISIGTYAVFLSEEQIKLRNNLWEFIFSKYSNDSLKSSVQKCILEYTQNLSYHEKNEDVILHDKDLILNFFDNELDKNEFIDCVLIEKYIGKLEWLGLTVDKVLLKMLDNSAFKLYNTVTDGSFSRKEIRLEYDKYQNYLNNKFKALLNGWELENLTEIFNDYSVILENKDFISNDFYRVTESVSRLLVFLGNRDFDQFLILYQKFARSRYESNIPRKFFTKLRMGFDKVEKFRSVLNKREFIYDLPTLHVNISNSNLREKDFDHFLKYLGSNQIKNFWFITKLLQRFEKYFKDVDDVVVKVLSTISKRAKKSRVYIPKEFFEYICSNYPEIYKSEFKTICDLYLIVDSYERHFDYSLEVLKSILEIEPGFIVKLMDSHFDKLHYLSNSALFENDFRKLWTMEKHSEVFTRILDYTNKFHRISDSSDSITKIFQSNDETQLTFLRDYLSEKTDKSAIFTVFNVVVSIFRNDRYEFLDLILDKEVDVDTFRNLDFVVSSITYSGSIIPRYQSRIEELNGYINHLQAKGDIKMLPYIQILDDRVNYYLRSIETARKREFLSDWGI